MNGSLSCGAMEHTIRDVVQQVVPVVEAVGALVIGVGVLVAFLLWLVGEVRPRAVPYEEVRLLLGRYLALGLEFELGADIVATAVRPSWDEIGKLAAIAGIRTALNYFLAKDLDRASRAEGGTARLAGGGIVAATRAILGRG
ncbi:MAG: hypothetical protein QOC95_63 [Thermoleophilaceae bacterium]|nr:hypothetical protein [Thermoleophilaceae bacterium]